MVSSAKRKTPQKKELENLLEALPRLDDSKEQERKQKAEIISEILSEEKDFLPKEYVDWLIDYHEKKSQFHEAGLAAEKAGKVEKAIDSYLKAADCEKDANLRAIEYFYAGLTAENARDFDKAEEIYKKAGDVRNMVFVLGKKGWDKEKIINRFRPTIQKYLKQKNYAMAEKIAYAIGRPDLLPENSKQPK